jgi:polysaccharide biosynthesis transport protein
MSSASPPTSDFGRMPRITSDSAGQLDHPKLMLERDGLRRSGSNALELLQIFRRHRTLLLIVFLTLSIIGTLIVLIMPPTYTADATVLFDPRKRQVVSSEPVLGRPVADSQMLQTVVESELQRILSRRVIDPIIDQFHLTEDPEFNRPLWVKWLDSFQSWSLWSPSVQEAIAGAIRALGLQPQREGPDAERERVITNLTKRLNAQVQGHSTAMKISFWSEDAGKSAAVVNGIAQNYVQLSVQDSTAAVQDALATLTQRSDDLRTKAADAESAAEEFKNKAHVFEDPRNGNLNSTQMMQIANQLVQARADLAAAEARMAESQSVSKNPGASPDVLRSQVIERLREEEAKLAAGVAEATSRSGSAYPVVVARQAALNAVKGRIELEMSNIIRGNQAARDGALARVNLLREQLADMWRQVESNSPAEIRYHQLKLEADVRHSLYQEYLRRIQEISQQLGTAQPDAQIISGAETPVRPSWPNLMLLLPCIAFVAATIATGSAVMADLFGKGFHSLEQAMETFGDQAFVLVPRLPTKRKFRLGGRRNVWSEKRLPSGPYAESIHSLRVQLRNSGAPFQTVLFTSPVEADGKTMTAVSFAKQEAQSGLKVLMIDADLRRPRLHGLFRGLQPGLSDLLSGEKSIDDFIQYDDETNLAFISAGRTVSSPIDLLSSLKMQEVLDEAAVRFDRIVVDSPAVIAVADARVLTRLMDRTVYIVQWGRTPRNLALRGFDMLHQSGGFVVGPVFAQVDGVSEAYGGSSYIRNYMYDSQRYL